MPASWSRRAFSGQAPAWSDGDDGASLDDIAGLDPVFEVTDRVWMEDIEPYDVSLAREGRVMEVLSEHLCQGWLEGYLLTGRHGFFSCYEAFIHIVDSMFNQHAKWLKVCKDIPWRRPVASLNYLLTSHVWRQDHNGFTHQDPGFLDLVVNKSAEVTRIPKDPVSVDKETGVKIAKLLEALDDHDDVQNVYSNANLTEEMMG